MKMTNKDYSYLKKRLDQTVDRIGAKKLRDIRRQKLGKIPDNRFAWDLFNASGIRIGDGRGMPGDIDLYAYLNDDHIQTALLKYVRDNSDLNIDRPEQILPFLPNQFNLTDPGGITNNETPIIDGIKKRKDMVKDRVLGRIIGEGEKKEMYKIWRKIDDIRDDAMVNPLHKVRYEMDVLTGDRDIDGVYPLPNGCTHVWDRDGRWICE